MLQRLFDPFGPIISLKVATDLQGKPRQFAHISFAKTGDALAAFKAANKEQFSLKDCHINVDIARETYRPDVKANRELHFCGGEEKTLRKALGKGHNRHVECISFRDGQQTGDGYILFDTEERALSALRRLTGARMRDKLTIDIWHPPSRTSHEGPTSSLTEPTPTPNTTPQQQKTPEIPQSLAEDLQIQQLFIGCLPSWLPEHDLHDRLTTMFEPFGKIKWLRIGYGRNSHKLTVPFCHVEYEKSEDAIAAYRASVRDPMQIMDHFILVALKKPPKPTKVLYFRDYLGTKTAFWDTLRDLESNIQRVVFFYNSSGMPTGNGHITFNTLQHASEALPKLHGRVAKNGSRLLLSYSAQRKQLIKVRRSRDNNEEFLPWQSSSTENAPFDDDEPLYESSRGAHT